MARMLLLVGFTLLALATPASAHASVGDEIVVLRDGGLTHAERAQAGVSTERELPIAGVEVVSAADRSEALDALRADPDVEWAEPNRPRRLSGDPLAGLLWGLNNTGQSVWWRRGTADADVDAPQAWAVSRGAGVTVAVVDTGVDLGHPDLAGRLVPGHDFVEDDGDPEDGHGHGTHVAGTIAAGMNGAGVIGVAPDASVMPLRVLDANGGGNSADVAAAFAYAGDRGVRVVNASLGSSYPSLTERRAIAEHPNTLYVVAAGNGGADSVGDDNDGAVREYPCTHEEPNLICVGATDSSDQRGPFSNYGATTVDLFAPGQDIVSTWARGRVTVLGRLFPVGDGYEIMLGTSMAAPHVAGAAALAGAVQPRWGALQLKAALLDGADRLPALAGTSVTGGRLNAARTTRIAAGLSPEPGPDPGPLGPEVPAGGETATEQPAPPASEPRISAVRLRGRPRVCRGRRRACGSRTATLSFRLGAEAAVRVRLQQRRCVRTRCRWRPGQTRTRHESAGGVRWVVGPRLAGMRLLPGRWRVRLATAANSSKRVFRVR